MKALKVYNSWQPLDEMGSTMLPFTVPTIHMELSVDLWSMPPGPLPLPQCSQQCSEIPLVTQ